jgi:hypothetical protein
MDTSQEYIDMCEKATEIQNLFQALEGDWYLCRCTDIKGYPHGYGLTILSCGDPDIKSELLIKSPTDVWLPRQDQLQNLRVKTEEGANFQDRTWSLLGDLINFMNEYETEENIYWSFEQWWLSFIMKTRFNKIWIGNDWKNE